MMLRINKYSAPILGITLIPLWWMLGFGFFVFHVSSLYIALVLRRSLLPKDVFQRVIVSLIAVLTFSLLYNSLIFDIGMARILAALNNISVLMVGYCHYTYFKFLYQRDEAWIPKVSKVLLRLTLISIALAVPLSYAVFSGGFHILGMPTLLGFLLPPMDNLLGLYQEAEFVARDWFGGGDMPRLKILSTNATASAGLIAISGFIATGLVISQHRRWTWVFLGLVLFTISATLTRAAFLGAALGVVVIALAMIKKKYYLVVVAAMPLLAIVALNLVPDMLSKVNDMREGSSNARFIAYQAAFDETMRVNPLIGLGVKPRVEDLAIPIGSHSTIFSALVRGGVLSALVALFSFFLIPLARGGRLALKLARSPSAFGEFRPYAIAAVGGLPSLLAYCALQDIDVYAPITVVFSTYLAGLMYWSERPSAAS